MPISLAALSYPKGSEEITGYIFEPWHYRYIGVELARNGGIGPGWWSSDQKEPGLLTWFLLAGKQERQGE